MARFRIRADSKSLGSWKRAGGWGVTIRRKTVTNTTKLRLTG